MGGGDRLGRYEGGLMSELTIVLKVAFEPGEAHKTQPTASAEVLRVASEGDGDERSAVVLLRIG